jgi:CheY-like chemotaxis protein
MSIPMALSNRRNHITQKVRIVVNVGRQDLVLMDIPMPVMDALTPPGRYGNTRAYP